MALQFELDISNDPPCDNKDNPGNYLCDLHYWGANKIEHKGIQVGRHDPTDFPVGELMQVLLRVTENRRNPYRNKEAVPVSRLIGMSVIRLCTHSYTSKENLENTELRGEWVQSMGFVQDLDHVYPAEYGHLGPKVSPKGVSTHVRITEPNGTKFVAAQHLAARPHDEREFPVEFATPSLAWTRMHRDAWVALRPVPDQMSFLETLVSHEKLMDTMVL